MLDDFRPSAMVLPGGLSGPFQTTIASDWLSVYEAARSVLFGCFSAGPYLGYVTLRKWDRHQFRILFCMWYWMMANIAESRCGVGRHNLGVFFWAAGSAMEGHLPLGVTLEESSPTLETE